VGEFIFIFIFCIVISLCTIWFCITENMLCQWKC